MTDSVCYFINEDPADQRVFADALKHMCPKTRCVMVSTGEEALDLMIRSGIIPDYILIELNLAGMDAVEFLRNIKMNSLFKTIPVIVHSATPRPEKVKTLKECGAAAIYFSSYDYLRICNLLNLYLESEILMHPQN